MLADTGGTWTLTIDAQLIRCTRHGDSVCCINSGHKVGEVPFANMARFLSGLLAQALLMLVAALVTSRAAEEGRAHSSYTPPAPAPASSGQRGQSRQTPTAPLGPLGLRSPLGAPPPPESAPHSHYRRAAPLEPPPPPPPLSPSPVHHHNDLN